MAIQQVVLATDGSPDAVLARRAALDVAGRAHARLMVVSAWMPWMWPAMMPTSDDVMEEALTAEEARHQAIADDEARLARSAGLEAVETCVEQGHPADVILDAAERSEADLVVVGSRGLGAVRRLVLGSISADVVHRSRVPVLVVRGGEAAWPPQRVVVGDDGSSDESEQAVAFALTLGGLLDAPVEVVEVVPPVDFFTRHLEEFSEEEAISAVKASLGTRVGALAGEGPHPQATVRIGHAAHELLEAAGAGALLVTGMHARTALQRARLGSVSTAAVHAAVGPVLVVPPA